MSLEGVEGVEDDSGRRKGKLNRVVADALTRLGDGTASTPRVHRLPRFPRISPCFLFPIVLLLALRSIHCAASSKNRRIYAAGERGRSLLQTAGRLFGGSR